MAKKQAFMRMKRINASGTSLPPVSRKSIADIAVKRLLKRAFKRRATRENYTTLWRISKLY
jgi:hypothetical protein